MRKPAALCLLALLTFSCSQSARNQETGTAPTETSDTIATRAVPPVAKAAKMPSAETKHYFSDPTNRDTFRLVLSGDALISARAAFTIQTEQGETIWEETFTASDLEASLVYEMETPIATLEEREAFIRKRVDDFFDAKHFSKPAVAPNDNFDPAFGDQVTWLAIKNDKNAVGFNYLLGKENGRRIAYSKLKNQVMVVGQFGG